MSICAENIEGEGKRCESDIESQIAEQLRLKQKVEDVRIDLRNLVEMADLFVMNSDEAITLYESAKDKLNDPPEVQRIFERLRPLHQESNTIVLDLQRRLQELIKKLD